MKIYIPQLNRLTESIGGGNTFAKNFARFIPEDISIIDSINNADVFFIVGPTTCERDEFNQAKQLGKKIILRLDGVPEDWRNRNTGTSRMLDYAKEAHKVIVQSKYILNHIVPTLDIETNKVELIYNGIDKSIFYPGENKENLYAHVHYRKDPNKRYEEVVNTFRDIWIGNKDVELWLIGRYPTMYKDYNFGFYNNENYKYWGIKKGGELAELLRQTKYFIWPSYADPAPNVLLEALHCGCEPIKVNDYGGSKELIDEFNKGRDFNMESTLQNYLKIFKNV